jgi:cyclophilin family peptidyl-prolyl cis-trans isomerase
VAVAVVAVIAVVVVLVGGDDGEDVASDGSTTTQTTASTTTAAAPAATECPPTTGSPERVAAFSGPPPTCIDPATTTYSARVVTNKGEFTIALDADAAPVTVNNFVVLSRYRYYDGVPFHRIVPGFVIQAGDGDGEADGSNDLGYTIDDELPASADAYVDHSVAMANAGPNTNGSQFFVVLPGGGRQLTPSYSLFGQVTEGTEVVDAIGELGGDDQKPTEDVTIETVEIVETPR